MLLFFHSFSNNSSTKSPAPTITTSNGPTIKPAIAPNKSSLFQSITTNETHTNGGSTTSINSVTSITKSLLNHGKPNCAPKPPGIQLVANKNVNGNGRPAVSRHHSMKTPR